jgi:hypothetical protein
MQMRRLGMEFLNSLNRLIVATPRTKRMVSFAAIFEADAGHHGRCRLPMPLLELETDGRSAGLMRA